MRYMVRGGVNVDKISLHYTCYNTLKISIFERYNGRDGEELGM